MHICAEQASPRVLRPIGLWFRVHRLEVWGVGFKDSVLGSEFGGQGLGFATQLASRGWEPGLRYRIGGSGFRVWVLGCKVLVFRFKV